MSGYGNMGVKRSIRTSGMRTNGINQVIHWFNGIKYQNTEFQSFPLYFLKFTLYNGCHGNHFCNGHIGCNTRYQHNDSHGYNGSDEPNKCDGFIIYEFCYL